MGRLCDAEGRLIEYDTDNNCNENEQQGLSAPNMYLNARGELVKMTKKKGEALRRDLTLLADGIITEMVKEIEICGPGNVWRYGEKGLVAYLVDKTERLYNLVWLGENPKPASVEASWKNIITTALTALLYTEGKWPRPSWMVNTHGPYNE